MQFFKISNLRKYFVPTWRIERRVKLAVVGRDTEHVVNGAVLALKIVGIGADHTWNKKYDFDFYLMTRQGTAKQP